MKDFDTWNGFKKAIHEAEGKLYKQRDIWWCSLGVNVGFEQDGTGKSYERPVVVLVEWFVSLFRLLPQQKKTNIMLVWEKLTEDRLLQLSRKYGSLTRGDS